jgi:hypothetical protein
MPRTGLATLIHMSYEGATIKSLGLLRAPGLFVCLLRQASSPRRQIKNPAQCAGFFYRDLCWTEFEGCSGRFEVDFNFIRKFTLKYPPPKKNQIEQRIFKMCNYCKMQNQSK